MFDDVLRACFLTSSLVAMLSLTLTIPMTTIADIILRQDVSIVSFSTTFLLFLHLCEMCISDVNVLEFADDTKVFRTVSTDGDKQHLQNDLDRLVKWSEKWQMLLNFGKCKCLHTGHGNLSVNYKMGDTVLGTTVKKGLRSYNKRIKVFQSSVILQLQRVIKFLS